MPLLENVQDYAVYIIGDALSLHFPGHLGGAAEADIALDDIKFLSSTCDCKLHHIIFLLQFNAQLLQAKQLPNPTQLLPRFLPQVCPHIFSKYLFHPSLFTVPSTPTPTTPAPTEPPIQVLIIQIAFTKFSRTAGTVILRAGLQKRAMDAVGIIPREEKSSGNQL